MPTSEKLGVDVYNKEWWILTVRAQEKLLVKLCTLNCYMYQITITVHCSTDWQKIIEFIVDKDYILCTLSFQEMTYTVWIYVHLAVEVCSCTHGVMKEIIIT